MHCSTYPPQYGQHGDMVMHFVNICQTPSLCPTLAGLWTWIWREKNIFLIKRIGPWTPLDLVLGKNSCVQDLSVCLSLIFDLCQFLEGPLKILETLILVICLPSRKHYIYHLSRHILILCVFVFQEKVSTCKMTITKMRVVGLVMRVFVVQLTNKSVEK